MIPQQEGWYTDPWGHHDAGWISEGVPTKLVRDGALESYDDPPMHRRAKPGSRLSLPPVR